MLLVCCSKVVNSNEHCHFYEKIQSDSIQKCLFSTGFCLNKVVKYFYITIIQTYPWIELKISIMKNSKAYLFIYKMIHKKSVEYGKHE